MIVKMIILRLLGSSDDKEREKIGVARPEGPPLRGFRYSVSGRGSRGAAPRGSPGSALKALRIRSTGRTDAKGISASDGSQKNRRYGILVQKGIEAKSAYRHWLNRRVKKRHRCIGRPMFQRRCQAPTRRFFSTGSTDGASEYCVGAMTSAPSRRFLSTG